MTSIFRHLFFILSFILLQACGGGGGTETTTTPSSSNNAAKLNAISDVTIAPGNTVNFTISAANTAGHDITFSADLTNSVYTRNATFNSMTSQFNWITSIADENTYQVTFTVTDNDVTPIESDSKTITITVINPSISAGLGLYQQYCESCHGAGGVGGTQTLVLGSGPLYVKQALGLIQGVSAAAGMGGISSNFSDPLADASSIGFYLCDLAGIATNDTTNCPP